VKITYNNKLPKPTPPLRGTPPKRGFMSFDKPPMLFTASLYRTMYYLGGSFYRSYVELMQKTEKSVTEIFEKNKAFEIPFWECWS